MEEHLLYESIDRVGGPGNYEEIYSRFQVRARGSALYTLRCFCSVSGSCLFSCKLTFLNPAAHYYRIQYMRKGHFLVH